ncbi:hypothetical protein CERZMDRAFT_80532 [Cercospora zeae-maydis SCOH1-5]|uniref:Alpha-carbonic anhydrase domain-containing protein n=1 Tax=Cercospora zeae-maydis SCOH1-5 TaxID=717836 RepID=A0A6A6FWL5_9PEZI|nr:hypothetical protein CERZMDRAFT_80532 [Cercospora zeae-maydis SCOH1-5]
MYVSKILDLAASLVISLSDACPIVERDTVAEDSSNIEARQSCPTKYDYSQEGRDWHNKCAAWAKCGNGQQQSPIDLPANSYAKSHIPVFAFPGGAVRGSISNRGFGPEWHPDAGAAVPTIRLDNEAYPSSNEWHTHTPESEHAFGGNKRRQEIHFVFGTGSTPKAVAGIGLDHGAASTFFGGIFQQLDAQRRQLPPVGSSARYPIRIDFSTGILEPNHFRSFWTYEESLTTPSCGEGMHAVVSWWLDSYAQWRSVPSAEQS